MDLIIHKHLKQKRWEKRAPFIKKATEENGEEGQKHLMIFAATISEWTFFVILFRCWFIP